jgi:RNA polymerase II subunit A small phosphatase-like protein
MSGNPITSVPEPGASGSADPLAGIITQVQPGQAPAARAGGPARPTRVAKAGDGKKKKKKQSPPPAAASSDVAAAPPAAAVAAPEAEPAAAATLPADAADPATQHSHEPSSTLVGHSTAATAAEPVSLEASKAPVDVTTQRQDLTEAAQTLVEQDKAQAAAPAPSTAAAAAPVKPAASARAAAPAKPKKKSGLARFFAALTCSSGAQKTVDAERTAAAPSEKAPASAKAAPAPVLAAEPASAAKSGLLGAPAAVPGTPSRNSSRRASLDRSGPSTTPGGGTKLPREETGDVMSGAVVPPGASFVAREGADLTPTPSKRGLAQGESDEEEEEDEEDEMGDYDDDEDHHEQRLIMQGGIGIPRDEVSLAAAAAAGSADPCAQNGVECPLLGPIIAEDTGRKCLVLDLDETLVHSSFKVRAFSASAPRFSSHPTRR